MNSQSNIIVTVNSIDQLNNDAWSISRAEPKKAFSLAESALKMAESLDYSKGKGEALATIGAAKLWQSHYDEAFDYCLEASRIFEDINTYIPLGRVKYTTGIIFFYISDYDNALRYFLESLESYHKGNSELGKADAYNGIGSVYYAIDENEKSLNYLKKSEKLCIKLEAYDILEKVLDGMGQAYINLKEYDNALKVLNECNRIVNEHNGSNHVKAHCYNRLASVSILQNKPKQALEFIQKSLDIRLKDEFHSGVAACLNNFGKAYLKLNDSEKAETYFFNALKLAKEYKAKDVEVEVTADISHLYEVIGKADKALEYYKIYHQLRDSIKTENADQKTKGLELRFKVEQDRNEKALLQKQHDHLKKYSEDLVTLSEIGQSLTALLSVEKIISTAQEKLNTLMDATSFGLGLYNKETNQINFPGYIEDGQIFPNIIYDVKEDQRLANICFIKKQEIVINNFEEEHSKWVKNYQKPKAGKQTLSIIYIPFAIENGSSGVVTVQSFKANRYNDYHVNMIKNLTVYMASALENAISYQNLELKIEERTKEITQQKEDLEKSNQLTSLLNEIGQQLTSSTNFESIFKRLHKNIGEFMDASCFGVRIYKKEEREIEYKFEIEKGLIDEEPFSVSMDNENNYSVICVKNNQIIWINDNLNEYTKYTKEIVVPAGELPHSLIFYPMSIGDRVIGLITVQSFQKFAYTQQHVDILKTLASFTSIALDNVNILENLERTVQERTEELVLQKDSLIQAYDNAELLNDIGREVTSSLSIADVVEKIYENTNKLMDCSIFGIGIHDPEKNILEIKGAMENGEKLPDFFYDLDQEESLTTVSFKESKEVIINDYEVDIRKYIEDVSTLKIGKRPKSILYIPLITKGKTIGTISVQSFKPNAYSDYHINIIRNLALYVATAIENAGLYTNMESKVQERTKEVVLQKEEIEKTYHDTRLLSQMGQEIISCYDLETIFDKMKSNVNQLIDGTIFSIRVCDYKTNEIEYAYTIEKGKRLQKARVSLDDIDNYSVWCVRNNKEIFINDHQNEYHKYTKKIVVVTGDLPDSLIFCPLVVKDKVIGVISAQSFKKHAYTPYHLDLLRSLGAFLAIALENVTILENLEETIAKRTAEVVQQKEIIEEKNKDITDSIRYAERIQNVILPSIGDFNKSFNNSFVYFKPRDIVSGDFYWLEHADDKIFLTVVDCTGHGVPGALVSLVGANGLQRCINEFKLRKPSEILDKLREIVTDTFANTGNNMKDGMDMALCAIDLKANKLEYAGAYNPLWIVRKGVHSPIEDYEVTSNDFTHLIEVKADKQPVGQYLESKPFTNHTIDLCPEDRIYLFTDGYADQFGGSDRKALKNGGKKFKYSSLKKLIIEAHDQPMSEQDKIFSNTFEQWKGDFEQIDDVCVIGVQLN